MPPRLLITGFGSFENVAINPSAILAQASGHPGAVLDVSYRAVDDFLERLDPQSFTSMMCIGVAVKSKSMRLEMSAKNVVGARRDILNYAPPPGKIEPDAPDALPQTLWPTSLVESAASGTGFEVSHDAGKYLCNYIFFRARRRFPDKKIAFLHVPLLEEVPLHIQQLLLGQILRQLD
jgi:pyrrolidone-carboxylate peptidase